VRVASNGAPRIPDGTPTLTAVKRTGLLAAAATGAAPCGVVAEVFALVTGAPSAAPEPAVDPPDDEPPHPATSAAAPSAATESPAGRRRIRLPQAATWTSVPIGV
jgi:hypothetical protein